MKILSCYVEGYGKIKAQEYTFDREITTFFAENGEGKSTLASFLKAMFYGLKGYTKRSVEFCDREHFYPFDGGRFGGNVRFEMGGDVYKIERFFGERSETSDSVKVYRNGEETQALGEDIGRAVFGVDKESFERTVFLDSGDIEIASTSSIHARLNTFLEGGENEDERLDTAKARLERAAKRYKKSRAGGDKISEETALLVKLNEGIDNAAAIRLALEDKYERSARLKEEIEELNAQAVAAQQVNERRTQFEHYDSLEEGALRAQRALDGVLARYPLGLPSEEETLAVNEYMGRSETLEIKLERGEFSLKDGEKLARLSGTFSQGVPSEEVLLEAEKDIRALTETEAKLSLLEGQELKERERFLQGKLAHAQLTQAQMEKTAAIVEEYKKCKGEWETTPTLMKREGKAVGKKYGLLAALFALVGLVGVGLYFVHALFGAAAIVVGVLGVLADGFVYLNKKSSNGGGENPQRQRLAEELRAQEDAIKAVLLPLGYCSGNGVVFDFATLQTDFSEYRGLIQGERARQAEKERARAQAAALVEGLTAFFREYALAGDTFVKLLSDLRSMRREFLDLQARKKLAAEERSAMEEELHALKNKVEGYQRKYGLGEFSAVGILEDIRTVARLSQELAEYREKAAAYKKEKGLGERSEREQKDLASLQTQLTEAQNERGKLEREIAADEQEVERLESYEEEKGICETRLRGYKRKHKLMTAAMELLEEAEGRLRDKYVQPIKNEFLYYAEIIERALGEKVVMTKNFELRFERNGMERSEKHLSSGQRSICALCFRLALIKNMYRGQLPFLILDDPFVGLDEAHMSRVREVLRSLCKDMQMVYFTCHESRKL